MSSNLDQQEDTDMGKGARSISQWCKDNNLSRSTGYKEVADGRLVAHKVGSRTIITDESDQAWRDSLPKLQTSNHKASDQ